MTGANVAASQPSNTTYGNKRQAKTQLARKNAASGQSAKQGDLRKSQNHQAKSKKLPEFHTSLTKATPH